MRIGIIGGTGTLGEELVKQLHKEHEVVVISRDEFKLYEISKKYNVKCIICDIRVDKSVLESLVGLDAVIHTAALKDIFFCEEFQYEAYLTNVVGASNVSRACAHLGIKDVIFMSTDKAIEPTSYYGKSKLLAENEMLKCGAHCVRSGNIWKSRRSIINTWDQMTSPNVHLQLRVTDPECTRFFISKEKLAKHIIGKLFNLSLSSVRDDEVSYPIQYSTSLKEILDNRYPNNPRVIIGLNKYEKLHEKLGECYSNDPKVFRSYTELMELI